MYLFVVPLNGLFFALVGINKPRDICVCTYSAFTIIYSVFTSI